MKYGMVLCAPCAAVEAAAGGHLEIFKMLVEGPAGQMLQVGVCFFFGGGGCKFFCFLCGGLGGGFMEGRVHLLLLDIWGFLRCWWKGLRGRCYRWGVAGGGGVQKQGWGGAEGGGGRGEETGGCTVWVLLGGLGG